MKKLLGGAIALGLPVLAQAQTSVSDIVTEATTTWGLVAAACVTIGTFTICYRLAKRIR